MAIDDIFNWHRVNENITTSGQFTEEQFQSLEKLGVRYIINLGLHGHEYALPDETALIADTDIEYIYLPVDFNNPTNEDFDKFCEAMAKTENEITHIHCIANYRVSAFLYRYYRDVVKEGAAKAKADMLSMWTPEGVWADFIAD